MFETLETDDPINKLWAKARTETQDLVDSNHAKAQRELDDRLYDESGLLGDIGRGIGSGIEGFATSVTDLGYNLVGARRQKYYEEDSARSWLGSMVGGITQFALGFIPLGGLAGKAGTLLKAGKWGKYGIQAARGAVTDFVAFNGDNRIVGDFLAAHPKLQPPVLSYLASDPNDSWATKRFKNALEGLGFGVATDFAFKTFKAWRAKGQPEAVKEWVESLEELGKKNPGFFETSGIDSGAVPPGPRAWDPNTTPGMPSVPPVDDLRPNMGLGDTPPRRGADVVPSINTPEFDRPGWKPPGDVTTPSAPGLDRQYTLEDFNTPGPAVGADVGNYKGMVPAKAVQAGDHAYLNGSQVQIVEAEGTHLLVEDSSGTRWSVLRSELTSTPTTGDLPSTAPLSVPRDASIPMC